MKLIEGNRSSMDESSLVGCKAGVGSECENPGKASLKGVEVALVLKKVGRSVVGGGTSKVRRCCIDRPRQSFDYGVMGVNHPASGF